MVASTTFRKKARDRFRTHFKALLAGGLTKQLSAFARDGNVEPVSKLILTEELVQISFFDRHLRFLRRQGFIHFFPNFTLLFPVAELGLGHLLRPCIFLFKTDTGQRTFKEKVVWAIVVTLQLKACFPFSLQVQPAFFHCDVTLVALGIFVNAHIGV